MSCRTAVQSFRPHAARLLPQLPDGYALCTACAALLTRADLGTRCPGPSPEAAMLVGEWLATTRCALCGELAADNVCTACACITDSVAGPVTAAQAMGQVIDGLIAGWEHRWPTR